MSDNVTPFGRKFDAHRIPSHATKADFRMLIAIMEAAGNVSDAKAKFLLALQTLHDAHPEYHTPGELLTAYGINPRDLDFIL